MSEENEAVEINETITPEVQEVEDSDQGEQPEQSAEQTPAQVEESQKTELTASMQKAMNKKHFQFKDQERRADALQKQLDDIQAQQPQEVAIPELPDAFEDDYAEKMVLRDEALSQQAQQSAQNAVYQAQQLQHNQQMEAQRQQELAGKERDIMEQVKKSGIDEKEFNNACLTIGQYGLGNDFNDALMGNEDSAQMIQLLGSDVMELDRVSRMNPMQKGEHLAALKIKAKALRPRQNNTPAPAADITGSGQNPDVGKYPHSKGAKFW